MVSRTDDETDETNEGTEINERLDRIVDFLATYLP
jgi:hypothetical protein